MNLSSYLGSKRLRKLGIISAGILLGLLLLLAAGYWLVVPGVADSLVRDKLAAAESKLGLNFKIEQVSTHGVSAVSLGGFSVVDPATDKPLFEAASVSASIDAVALLFGNREISGVTIDDPSLYLHRNADGSTNIEQIIARKKAQGASEAAQDSAKDAKSAQKDTGDPDAVVRSFLQFFGGKWPDITVNRARVVLKADEAAKPWAIDEISTDKAALASQGSSATFKTALTIVRGKSHPQWSIPASINVETKLQLPLNESTGSVEFDTPLQVAGLGPYPFLRLGIGGLSLKEKNTIALQELSLGVQGGSSPTPLARIDAVEVGFRALKMPITGLRPTEIHIRKPLLMIEHDAQFGSGLNDLIQLTRAPLAGHVVGTARRFADDIATQKGLDIQEDDTPGGGMLGLLKKIDWNDFLGKQAPQLLEISDAAIHITDARPLPLVKSDPKVALEGGNFKFSHRVINGELVFQGGFKALANEADARGEADIKYTWNYRNGALDLQAKLDALSIPWLVQISSAKFADKLRGGRLYADVKARREAKKKRLNFSGLVSAEDLTFFLGLLAEEPVEHLSASYNLEGFYDPDMPLPQARLLKPVAPAQPGDAPGDQPAPTGNAASADLEAEPQPPTHGALVISKGHFEFNGIKGEFRPALYGLDGLKKRPTRFATQIELPEVAVQTLFAAVPDAIKGPLTGTQMKGKFAWTLDLEAPLYRAGDMRWKSKPVLRDFELVSMPAEVDVRKLRGKFDMTIYDPTLKWSRKVTIPEMRPVPLDWLVTQSGLDAETFEQRRRKRQWPPRYAPNFVGDPDDPSTHLQPHPAPWAKEEAAARAEQARALPTLTDGTGLGSLFNQPPNPPPAPKPEPKPAPRKKSRNGKIPADLLVMLDEEKKEHPYGPYVYVPLQYISPWMLRAAMTTEDNSFFTHHGFNWRAIRESVAANLNAGRYVRGASTISMQLIKNIFLTRKKVMVRKLREAFLVWLMEDVVDLPKPRILELYFNIIEYGPGIFGVHDAAVHYFGKRADKLSLSEVAWLVSIVPNPKKYHFYYERGELSDAWFRRTLRYVRFMMNRDRVTEAEYEAAKLDKPTFYKPKDGQPMMRLERDPAEVEALIDENAPLEIPSFRDLFGP